MIARPFHLLTVAITLALAPQAALLHVGSAVQAVPQQPKQLPEKRTPIRVYIRRTSNSGHWVARVNINGRFEGNLVIDTGATMNFLSDRTARRLGIRIQSLKNEEEKPLRAEYDGGSNARVSVIDRLEMGELKLARVPFLMVRGERMQAVAGEYVDGIIGLDLLKRFAARIDLSQHEMLLWLGGKLTPQERAEAGADRQFIRLSIDKNRAEMVATINDEVKLKMLLDTGATKTLIQKTTSDSLELRAIGTPLHLATMYGRVDAAQARINAFALGAVSIELPTIRFVTNGAPTNMPALLGLDVLSAQPILLDFPAERMYLLPAAR